MSQLDIYRDGPCSYDVSVSRSGLETYQDCPRKYFYSYVAGGRGYSSTVDKAIPLQQGNILHSGMEVLMKAILNGEDGADEKGLAALRAYPHTLEERDFVIVEALYLAWLRTRRDKFLEEYKIISVEEPTAIKIKNVTIYVRGDVLVQSNYSELLWSVDWKCITSSNNWGTKWKREPQGFLQTWASREKYPEVAGTIFEGFVKGVKRDGAYVSPLVRAFMAATSDNEPIFSFEKDGFGKGVKGVPVEPWKREWPGGMGLEGWIGWLPYEVVQSSIVTSPPVLLPPDWDTWLLESDRGLMRDYEDGLWERRYKDENCRWCPFDPICAGDKSLEGMIEEGLLVTRPLSPREEVVS